MLHRRVVVGAITDVVGVVERVAESLTLGPLEPVDIRRRDVCDFRDPVGVAAAVSVVGDDLQTPFAVVGIGVVAGTLDLQRLDQVQQIEKLVPVAVIRVPTRDVEKVGAARRRSGSSFHAQAGGGSRR